jgi:predicted CoA-substrate-specific enzyme activase
MCSVAEDHGWSRDICSYARTDFGSVLSGKTPVGRLPKPDLLLCCTNICQTVLFWYRVLAHHFKVPLILIDTPFIYEEATDQAVEYVKMQLEKGINTAERVARRDLDKGRLQDVIRYAYQASMLWLQVLETAKARPAPITAFDEFIHLAPIVEMRGEEFTVHYYRAMLEELEQRVENGVGALKNEKKRLLWDNLPIWFRVRKLSNLLAARGVALVASTYTNAWGELAPMMDPQNPLDGQGLLRRRRDPALGPLLQALLRRPDGSARAPGPGARRPGAVAGGRPQRSALLLRRAGRDPPGRLHGDPGSVSADAIQALGIDAGSTTTKIAGVDGSGKLIWHLLEPTEPNIEEQTARLADQAPQDLPLVSTGYGRNLAKRAGRQVTEITCHAKGAFTALGHGGTLIDIGGQDSKVIVIAQDGQVKNFMMNDKCAAGTGRFLEVSAARLKVALENMGRVALQATDEVSISSTCTVFAESEIVSLLARGHKTDTILRGLHRSLIKRIASLAKSAGLIPPLMLSGGVAQNPAVAKILEEELGHPVELPQYPQLMGAYGAALIALGE